ncbi:MAG: DUF502 domain-containing protein [Thermodesulfobacteriota bacterium]|nr:DUF502 domain-containing protein [Thermodesulfobacteriota bacterium]
MKAIIQHIKTYILRGFFAIIPIALSFFAIKFIYSTIDKRFTGMMDKITGFSFPGIGILLVIIILYVIGITASNLIGKQFLGIIEKITERIPLIKTTYKIGQQLAVTLSLPEKQVFRRAVLVEYLKPGIWTIGFVTGTIIDRKNSAEKLLKVFIPTPPNPTSGTMVVVKESETRDPGWSVEDALKAVISGGIIGPGEIT